MADQKLSALSAALVASGNDLFYMVTTGGVSQKIPFTTIKSSLALQTYAATGNKYVMTDTGADTVSSFRLVQSGNSITISTAGNNIVISASTGNLSTKQDTITYPLGINSGGTGFASVISATNLIGFNSSGTTALDSYRLAASDNMTILRVGTAFFFSANTGTGASTSGIVYAATGNSYIVTDLASDLTNEFRLVQSGNSITISTAGNLIVINAVTNAGGSAVVYAATGNSYIVTDLAGDLTNEFRLVQSGNSITISTAGNLITVNAVTSDISGKQDTITFPLGINSGGTGFTSVISATNLIGFNSSGTTALDSYRLAASDNMTIVRVGTAFFFSANTGTGASTSGITYAPTGGFYVTWSADTLLSSEKILTASDNIVVTTGANNIWISAITNSGVAAGTGTQIIRIPMALMTVEINSANAFWTAQSDTTRMDRAYINMVDSGRSVSTWWCNVPSNVNSTPAWNLEIVSEAATGGSAGGFIILNVDGMSAAYGTSANTLAASTIQLVAAGSFQVQTAGILTMSTMSATNFDSALTTSGTHLLKVKVARQGNVDTLNSDWYIYSVNLRCTVNT